MSFNALQTYVASGVRELHDQRLLKMWPSDAGSRESHRMQLDFAALTTLQLRQVMKLRSDCAELAKCENISNGNSRAELQLLTKQIHACICIKYSDGKLKPQGNVELFVQNFALDYPKNFVMRWQRCQTALDTVISADIEQAATEVCKELIRKCEERASKYFDELYGRQKPNASEQMKIAFEAVLKNHH